MIKVNSTVSKSETRVSALPVVMAFGVSIFFILDGYRGSCVFHDAMLAGGRYEEGKFP
jgi:hypothetical protein